MEEMLNDLLENEEFDFVDECDLEESTCGLKVAAIYITED